MSEPPFDVFPVLDTQTIAWIICLDKNGAPEENVKIEIKMTGLDDRSGEAFDSEIISATSAPNGVAVLIIPRGEDLYFKVRRNKGIWKGFTGVDTDVYELPSLIGP